MDDSLKAYNISTLNVQLLILVQRFNTLSLQV